MDADFAGLPGAEVVAEKQRGAGRYWERRHLCRHAVRR
jgi:hypothetical protein